MSKKKKKERLLNLAIILSTEPSNYPYNIIPHILIFRFLTRQVYGGLIKLNILLRMLWFLLQTEMWQLQRSALCSQLNLLVICLPSNLFNFLYCLSFFVSFSCIFHIVCDFCLMFWCILAVRGYITGSTDTSLWTVYAEGIRNYCGNSLPEGIFFSFYLWFISIQLKFLLLYFRIGKEWEVICKYTYSNN